MYANKDDRNDHDGRYRLNTHYKQLLDATSEVKKTVPAVYVRNAVKKQLELDNNQLLQDKAKKYGMSVQQFTDFAVSQLLVTNDNSNQANKRGTENEYIQDKSVQL